MKRRAVEEKGGRLIKLNHNQIAVAVEFAEQCIAKELSALFAIAAELGFSEGFKLVGGTARDFVFGIILGIDVIERSSDFDVVIPGLGDHFLVDFSFCERLSNMVAERCGSSRLTPVDPALGCPVGDKGQLAYEEAYKTADLSLARMTVEQQGDFYVIGDEYGGIEDTADRVMRLVNLNFDNPQDAFPGIVSRIFMRYIPYWTKLLPYGFEYESRTQGFIDGFLASREYDLQDVLCGIIMAFEKAHDNIAVAATLERFGLIGLLNEKLGGLRGRLGAGQAGQLTRLAGLLEGLVRDKVLEEDEVSEINLILDEPVKEKAEQNPTL